MPKRGETRPRPDVGDTSDPATMAFFVRRYTKWLRVRNYSPRTVENREYYLDFFVAWTLDRGITRPTEVTRPLLEDYQEDLYEHRQPDGSPLTVPSQLSRLVAVRAFFKWLAQRDMLLANPASDLELPRVKRNLPKNVMGLQEVRRVFAQPDLTSRNGVRDRTILEVLYSTGIRRMELCNLLLADVAEERGLVTVRRGKGNKDRIVPIGHRALAWIAKYLDEHRPEPAAGYEDALFLTIQGRSITTNRLTMIVREHMRAAGVVNSGSCHAFRHAMATGMLDNDADIRFIQEQLGHAELSTTQIYTRVSIKKLQEVHAATHPVNALDDLDELGDSVNTTNDRRH